MQREREEKKLMMRGYPCKAIDLRCCSLVHLHHLSRIMAGLLGNSRIRLFLLLGLVLLLPFRLASIAARLHVVPAPLPHLAPREGTLTHLAQLPRQVLFLHPSRHSSSGLESHSVGSRTVGSGPASLASTTV